MSELLNASFTLSAWSEKSQNISSPPRSAPHDTHALPTSKASSAPTLTAASPIYEGSTPFQGEEIPLTVEHDVGMRPERVHDLMSFPPSECGDRAVATVQLLEACCKLRDYHFLRLEEARDALQNYSIQALSVYHEHRSPSEDNIAHRTATLQALQDVRALHAEVEDQHSRYQFYQGAVREARKGLLLAFDDSLGVNLEAASEVRRAERAGKMLTHSASMRFAATQKAQASYTSETIESDSHADSPFDVNVHGVHGVVKNLANIGGMRLSPNGLQIPGRKNLTALSLIRIIIRFQSIVRGKGPRRKHLRILLFWKKCLSTRIANHFYAWIRLLMAIKHANRRSLKVAFAGLLGFSNVKVLRRSLGVNKVHAVQQQCRVDRLFRWWRRYCVYNHAPFDDSSGKRTVEFHDVGVLQEEWDNYVKMDEEDHVGQAIAMKYNVGVSKLSSFKKWRKYTNHRRTKKDRLLIAKNFYEFHFLSKPFQAWYRLRRMKVYDQSAELATKRFYFSRIRMAVFNRRADKKAYDRIHRVRALHYWVIWRRRFQRFSMLNCVSLLRLSKHRRLALSVVYAMTGNHMKFAYVRMWKIWRDFVSRKKLWRRYVGNFWIDYRTTLKRTCFKAWAKVSQDHSRRREGRPNKDYDSFEPLMAENYVTNVDLYLRDYARYKEEQVMLQIHACTELLQPFEEQIDEDVPSPEEENVTQTEVAQGTTTSPSNQPGKTGNYSATDDTVYRTEVPIISRSEIRAPSRRRNKAYEEWSHLARFGDHRMSSKIMFLLVWFYYNRWDESGSSIRYYVPHLLPKGLRNDKVEEDNKSPTKSKGDEGDGGELSSSPAGVLDLVGRLNKAKMVLMSVVPEFCDPKAETVDVNAAWDFVREQQERNYILVTREQRRDKRILQKFDCRLKAQWLNHANPTFTVLPLNRTRDLSVWEFLRPEAERNERKKKKKGHHAAQQMKMKMIPPPLPNKKKLPYLLRMYMQDYLEEQNELAIIGRHILRLRVVRTLWNVDYCRETLKRQGAALINVAATTRRDRLVERTTFLDMKRLDRQDESQLFDKVTGNWHIMLSPGDHEFYRHIRQITILDLIGFNPLITPVPGDPSLVTVPQKNQITSSAETKKGKVQGPTKQDQVIASLAGLHNEICIRAQNKKDTLKRYSTFFSETKGKGVDRNRASCRLVAQITLGKAGRLTLAPPLEVKGLTRASAPQEFSPRRNEGRQRTTTFRQGFSTKKENEVKVSRNWDADVPLQSFDLETTVRQSDSQQASPMGSPSFKRSLKKSYFSFRVRKGNKEAEDKVSASNSDENQKHDTQIITVQESNEAEEDEEARNARKQNEEILQGPQPDMATVTPSVEDLKKVVSAEVAPKVEQVQGWNKVKARIRKQPHLKSIQTKGKKVEEPDELDSPRSPKKSPRSPKNSPRLKKSPRSPKKASGEKKKPSPLPKEDESLKKHQSFKKFHSFRNKPQALDAEAEPGSPSRMGSFSPKRKFKVAKDVIAVTNSSLRLSPKELENVTGKQRASINVDEPLEGFNDSRQSSRRSSINPFKDVVETTDECDALLSVLKSRQAKEAAERAAERAAELARLQREAELAAEAARLAALEAKKPKSKPKPKRKPVKVKTTPKPVAEVPKYIRPVVARPKEDLPKVKKRTPKKSPPKRPASPRRQYKPLPLPPPRVEKKKQEPAQAPKPSLPRASWRDDGKPFAPAIETLLEVSLRYTDLLNVRTREEIDRLRHMMDQYLISSNYGSGELPLRKARELSSAKRDIKVHLPLAHMEIERVTPTSPQQQQSPLKSPLTVLTPPHPSAGGTAKKVPIPVVPILQIPADVPADGYPTKSTTPKEQVQMEMSEATHLSAIRSSSAVSPRDPIPVVPIPEIPADVPEDDYPTKPMKQQVQMRLSEATRNSVVRPMSAISSTIVTPSNRSTPQRERPSTPEYPASVAQTSEMNTTSVMVRTFETATKAGDILQRQTPMGKLSVKNRLEPAPGSGRALHVPRDMWSKPWNERPASQQSSRSQKEEKLPPPPKSGANETKRPPSDQDAWQNWFREMEKMLRSDPRAVQDIIVSRRLLLRRQIAHAISQPTGQVIVEALEQRLAEMSQLEHRAKVLEAEKGVMQIVGKCPLARGIYPSSSEPRTSAAKIPKTGVVNSVLGVEKSASEIGRMMEQMFSSYPSTPVSPSVGVSPTPTVLDEVVVEKHHQEGEVNVLTGE